MPHHPEAPSGSPVFRIAAAGALRGEARAFRSLDAGGEGHGGVLSMWGEGGGICVFVGGLFRCGLLFWLKETLNAMEFEETKPQMDADERRFNALSEYVAELNNILNS